MMQSFKGSIEKKNIITNSWIVVFRQQAVKNRILKSPLRTKVNVTNPEYEPTIAKYY